MIKQITSLHTSLDSIMYQPTVSVWCNVFILRIFCNICTWLFVRAAFVVIQITTQFLYKKIVSFNFSKLNSPFFQRHATYFTCWMTNIINTLFVQVESYLGEWYEFISTIVIIKFFKLVVLKICTKDVSRRESSSY